MPLIWLAVFTYGTIYYDVAFFKPETFTIDNLIDMQGFYYPKGIIDNIRIWQLVTYAYIHADFYHLLTNIVTFLFFSYFLEKKYRWWRLLIVFHLGAIAGALLYGLSLHIKHSGLYVMVGASAGIYSLMGLYISEFWLNRETINNKALKITISVLLLVSHAYEYTQLSGKIAVISHLGGFVFGLSPALLYIPNYRYEKWEVTLLLIATTLTIFYFVVIPVWIYGF